MSNLYDTIKEFIGEDDKAKEFQSRLGEYMLPKTEYAKIRDTLKERDAELEQFKLANMDKEQKLEHEIAKTQAMQKEMSMSKNRLEAEQLFVKAGLSSDVYSTILESSVSDDREKSMALVNGFVSILAKEKETAVNKAKEDFVNQTPKPQQGGEPQVTEPKKFRKTF